MRLLRLIAEEARRVDGYRTERHVSLLSLVVTEIADYAALCARLRAEALADALGAFARTAAEIVQGERDGLVVRCGGGELLAVFADPTSAVLASWSLHRGALSLRTGIHLGQVAIERTGFHVDVFGRHMHRASCVARAAGPGEILVTEPVADNARSWLEETSGPELAFAPRGRVRLEGDEEPQVLFAVAEGPRPVAAGETLPPVHIEIDTGGGRRVLFDAGVDRRILIGRSPGCDIRIASASSSKRHAWILCEGSEWLLSDLGSTNGTQHNGRTVRDRRPLAVGDRIGIGEVVLTVTRLRSAQPSDTMPRLRVDLVAGIALFDGEPLPLSAAELVWFAYLTRARRTGADGWVVAGQDGHDAFRAFARELRDRQWMVAVRTRPLLDLMAGRDIDDEDLRNLRGKTVQKLKRFAAEHPGAAMLVPEPDGKHCQRLPLAAPSIEIVDD